MKANVSARTAILAFTALLAAMLLLFSAQAFALEEVAAKAASEAESYPANTWAPLSVQINNESAYDISIQEAGFTSVPDGLERRGELVTAYQDGQKVVKAGTSTYVEVHSMEVRKVAASQAKQTAKTADGSPFALCLLAFAAVSVALFAARNGKAGALSVLLVGVLATGSLIGLPAQGASAAAFRETASCSVEVTIDGAKYAFPGYVIYTYETDTPTPAPEPETVGFAITKVWDDADNQDGIRPDSVKVNILADGEVYKAVEITASDADASGNWVLSDYANPGNGLPKYNDAGGEVVYTVEEVATDAVTGTDGVGTYAMKVEGSMSEGFTITNTHTPETMDITLTKTWWIEGWYQEPPVPGQDPSPGWTPSDDDVEAFKGALTLKAGGTAYAGVSPEFGDLSAPEQKEEARDGREAAPYTVCTQTVTWRGVPKYRDGSAIAYTVEEAAMESYNASNSGVATGTATSGFSITNRYGDEVPSDGEFNS